MLTALVGLFGFCEHVVNDRLFGWPITDPDSKEVLEHCSKCGATRMPTVAFVTKPKYDVPRYQPIGVEMSQEELVAMQAAASYNSKVRRIRRK
jgi:hypothetical protein